MKGRFNRACSRRQLLRGMGVSAAVAPFLPLLGREAEAADGPIKRLVLFYTPDGTIDTNWKPSGTETSFTLSPILQPLSPWQEKLIVLHGLKMTEAGPGGAHFRGMAALWSGSRLHEGNEFQGDGFTTGWGSGQTIDQAVVQGMDTSTLPFSSLEFGVQCKDSHVRNRMIYAGDSQPIPPETDPRAMFDRLFSDVGLDPMQLARLKAQRHSVIDSVKEELAALQPIYGAEDALKVERHLDAVREIEARLDLETPACTPPDAPPELEHEANANYPEVGALMMQMLAGALACDLTRVASIQWSRATTGVQHSWLGHSTSHHGVSHGNDADKNQKITAIHTWYAQQFATFLSLLDAIPEPLGEGSLLDNTLVVWGQELATPNHGLSGVPFVIAGSAAGTLTTNRFYSFNGTGHHRLLISIGRAMGLDIGNFGNLDGGEGPLGKLGV